MFHYEHMHIARTRKEIINVFTCILDLCFAVLQSNVGNRHVNENITFVYIYTMRLYAVCCDAGAADIYR